MTAEVPESIPSPRPPVSGLSSAGRRAGPADPGQGNPPSPDPGAAPDTAAPLAAGPQCGAGPEDDDEPTVSAVPDWLTDIARRRNVPLPPTVVAAAAAVSRSRPGSAGPPASPPATGSWAGPAALKAVPAASPGRPGSAWPAAAGSESWAGRVGPAVGEPPTLSLAGEPVPTSMAATGAGGPARPTPPAPAGATGGGLRPTAPSAAGAAGGGPGSAAPAAAGPSATGSRPAGSLAPAAAITPARLGPASPPVAVTGSWRLATPSSPAPLLSAPPAGARPAPAAPPPAAGVSVAAPGRVPALAGSPAPGVTPTPAAPAPDPSAPAAPAPDPSGEPPWERTQPALLPGPNVSARAPRRRPLLQRILAPVVLGSVMAVAALLGRLGGVLEGPAGFAVAAVLVLLVPTSRELARRVLFAGCLLLGWTPLLWWTSLPVGPVGRVTIELTVLAGVVGAAAAVRPRALLPRVRTADVMLPLTAALGTWTLWPWLMAKSAQQTLGLLMTGSWDNVAHFSMVHTVRLHGVTVDTLGGGWQFANYPEGFHTVVASVQELLTGPIPGGLAAELGGYTRGVGVVVIGATLTVVAGVCALPPLRRRPVVAVPAAALAASVFLLGPGGQAVENAFSNFLVAGALICALALVVVPLARPTAPLPMAVMGGAVVGIANCWALLLVLAVPVVIAAMLPLRRSRYRTTATREAMAIVLIAAVLACLVRTAFVLSRVVPDALLTPGGLPSPGLGLVVFLALALVVACPATRSVRISFLIGVPLVGFVVVAIIASAQITDHGKISYYALKFASGLEMVLPVLLIVPVGLLLARRERRTLRGPLAGIGAAVLAVAATQAFGLAIPDATAVGLPPQAPGAVDRATQLRLLDQTPDAADLAARIVARPPPTRTTFYLDVPTDGEVHPILAAQWYLALTDTWSSRVNTLVGGMSFGRGPFDQESVAAAARRLLVADPHAVILVRPGYLGTLLDALDDTPDLAARVGSL